MMKKFALISVVFLVFGIVLGGPLLAKAEIIQSLLIGVKQDPGGGFKNDDLNATYYFRNLSFQNFESATPTANITYGALVFDGVGNYAGPATQFNSDGTTEAGTLNGTYSVNAEGSFDMTMDNPTSPDAVLTGHISRDADRQFIVVSQGQDTGGSIHQGIAGAVRAPDNPFVPGDLNGTWRFRDLEIRDFEEVYREASACTVTIEINAPNWTLEFSCLESDGTTDNDTLSGNYTYTPADNSFNFFATGNPEVLFSAYLSRDLNILIFTRGSSSGGDIGLFEGIAIREASKTFADADLSGAYFFHQASFYDFETNSREAATAHGTITFDGNSNWTATLEVFESDGGSGPVTGSGTYSVNADGSFTFIITSDTPNITLTGDISGDNNTLIMTHSENVSGGGGSDGGGGGGGGCLISTSASD